MPIPTPAFTLIELMIVVVIIGIVAAMIIPEMKGTYEDSLLRATGRDLITAFSLASSRAVGFNRPYRVAFDTPQDRYAVEREINDGTQEAFVPVKDISGAEGKWDPRISVEIDSPADNSSDDDSSAGATGDADTISSGPANLNAISFYPDGTADAAEIHLRDRAGFQVVLKLNPITARVHLTEPEQAK
jgi:prepilin-type N-terminal cleavage/methylation domain-containing protein